MPRLDDTTQAALDAGDFYPAIFAKLTFKSQTAYISSLPCSYTWGGNTYAGAGTLGAVSGIEETNEIEAKGLTISLSGIDPVILPECMNDIKLGAEAILYLGLFTPQGALIATPTVIFAGIVDQPTVNIDAGTCTISLQLESHLIRLQRACNLMLTPADQKITYPNDTGLDQVNLLNWQALRWG